MNSLLQLIQGKKTYATCLVVVALLVGQWAKLWTIAPELYASLCALALMFLRSGIKREVGGLVEIAEPEEPDATAPGGAPKTILPAFVVILALGVLAGCGTLDKTGIYGGDKALYDADVTIATSYDLLHTFVKWEYDNRDALSGTPEIKQYADTVRRQAPQWIQSAVALRDAYKAAPTNEARSALTTSIAVLRQAMVEATKYLSSHTGPS